MPPGNARQRFLFWTFTVCSAAVAIFLSYRFDVGLRIGDDSRDILAAKSILLGGYSSLQFPGHPPANFPLPGFPILLSPFVACFEPHWALLRAVPFAFTCGAFWLTLKLVRPHLSTNATLVFWGLLVFNPSTLALSTEIIADASYLFFLILSLLLLRRTSDERFPGALILTAGGASLIRPEGLLILAAISMVTTAYKRWNLVKSMGIAFGAVLFVLIGNVIRTGQASGYTVLWQESLPFSGIQSYLVQTGRVLQVLVLEMLTGLAYLPAPGWPQVLVAFCCLAWIAMMYKGFRVWQSEDAAGFIAPVVGIYFIFHVLVHVAWRAVDVHYFWPLLPFAAFIAAFHLDRMGKKLKPVGTVLITLCFSITYGWQIYAATREPPSPFPNHRAPRLSFGWVDKNLPEDAFILTPRASAFTLYTGRFSLAFLGAADADEFHARLLTRGITHLLTQPTEFLHVTSTSSKDPTVGWRRIEEWVAQHPARYRLVYRSPREKTAIYEVNASASFLEAYTAYTELMRAMREGAPVMPPADVLKQLSAILGRCEFPTALNAYAATALLANQRLDIAEGFLHKALQQEPGYTLAWINLGRIHQKNGNKAAALQAYARAQATLTASPADAAWGSIIARERQELLDL